MGCWIGGLFVGLWIGTAIGIGIMCLFISARNADDTIERMMQNVSEKSAR